MPHKEITKRTGLSYQAVRNVMYKHSIEMNLNNRQDNQENIKLSKISLKHGVWK